MAYVAFSGTVVASEEVRNSWAGAVKSHLTIMNTFRSGKPRFKGMERCRFCLSRSVLPTGKRHHAQSAITDGKNCAGKSPEFCHQFFIAQQCNILLASCSHNSFSNMVVVLSIYCCRNLAFILRSKTIFSVQINAYASLL